MKDFIKAAKIVGKMVGVARLELAKTEVDGFTVHCNCRYATPPKLLEKGLEPSTVRLQVGRSTN
jgi:hypothetical protein